MFCFQTTTLFSWMRVTWMRVTWMKIGVLSALTLVFTSPTVLSADLDALTQKLSEQEVKAVETLLKTLEALNLQDGDQNAVIPLLETEIQSAQNELTEIEKQIIELKRSVQQLEVIHEWLGSIEPQKNESQKSEQTFSTPNTLSTPNLVPSVSIQFSDYTKDRVFEILKTNCFACHANGNDKGGLSFDGFASEEDMLNNHVVWWAVLKNIRSGLMPPQGMPKPSGEDIHYIAGWIKKEVFKSDPDHPNPGSVTLRRLNRTEYRNTIKDLMGYDYNTFAEFPPDDTGFGFDTIGEVLSISPMLLEKYLEAAAAIVEKTVPTETKVMPVDHAGGREFRNKDGEGTGRTISFYEKDEVIYTFTAQEAGDYQIELDLEVDGEFDFDPGECRVQFFLNGDERLNEHYKWQSNQMYHYAFNEAWEPGKFELKFTVEPLVDTEKRINNINFEIHEVRIKGPLDESKWVHPPNYHTFFTKDAPPANETERLQYAKELLDGFVLKAFRRPVDDETINNLTAIAQTVYNQSGKTFEQGIAQAMIAVLASPRFIYRIEETETLTNEERYPNIDEYALASRLSYFLWSTMPDEELFALASKRELRKNLEPQVQRMLKDDRSQNFVENFTGQWLQARDVETIPIDVRRALDLPRRRRGQPNIEFDDSLRNAMRNETESLFTYIMLEDRSLLEMLDSNYTFLNEELAKHYGIEGVEGSELRKVELPETSPFGGVLTQGTVLTVTSNPTRTSPVKRGLYILENILGTPAPPPPPDVPELEESEKEIDGRQPTLREILEIHRQQPLCNSCHARFDPLGLAFENFTAFGTWRDKEKEQPINASGELITGETFNSVKELKKILVDTRRKDFYRCLTEKLLTYAIGRGLDYRDVQTVDEIVTKLEESGGAFSSLLTGVIESAPFQKRGDRVVQVSQTNAN